MPFVNDYRTVAYIPAALNQYSAGARLPSAPTAPSRIIRTLHASISTLTDDFAALDTTSKWVVATAGGGSATSSGGQLVLTSGTATTVYTHLASQAAYDWSGDSAFIQFLGSTGGGASTEVQFGLRFGQMDGQNDNAAFFIWTPTSLNYRIYNGPTAVDGTVVAGYNPATHGACWRVRHDVSAGRVHFETSPDGGTWTSRTDVAVTFTPLQAYAFVSTGHWNSAHAANTATFDNLNTIPVPTGSGSGSWSFTGAGTGTRPAAGSGSGSWSFAGSGTGARTPKGSGTGGWQFTGAGAGTTVRSGSGIGSWAFTGAGSGTSARQGSGTGAWAFTGAGTGTTVRSGSGSGLVTWTGSGTGSAPTGGERSGSGTGNWTFTGSGTGSRASRGTGSGLLAWVGTGSGTTVRSGSGAGAWTFTGSGAGMAPGGTPQEAALEHTLNVGADDRLTTVGPESRTLAVPPHVRLAEIAADDRLLTV